MKRFLMTLAVFGAVAHAAAAQEEQPAQTAPMESPAKPAPEGSTRAKDSEGAPAAAKPAAGSEGSSNLKVGFYGIADIALLYRNHVLNDPTKPAAGQTGLVELISGGRNQSRIGLKGSYEMGDGLRAVIQLEKGINYNDGTIEDGPDGDPIQFLNRMALIGLEKDGIGRLTVGRQLTTMYDMAILFDPMGYSPTFSWLPTAGSADSTTGKFNSGRFATRVDNVVKYAAKFPGLQIGAHYALGENTVNIGANSKFGGGIIFGLGPLSAAVVYDQRNGNATLANTTYYREQTTLGAAKLSLFGGRITPVAGYRRYVRTLIGRADDLFWGGITLKATDKLSFTFADYYDLKRDGTSQDDNLAVARANYFLSKIVELYATYGYASSQNNGLTGVLRANDTLPVATDQSGVSLGFRVRYGY